VCEYIFANISDLQCNLEKTSVIPIGGNFNTSDKLCPELNLKWESEFTLLGFQIGSRLNNYDINCQKCFKRVHAISRKWARYQLSLKGRITIAKTFMLTQFAYIALVLEPSTSTYDEIDRIIEAFLSTQEPPNPAPRRIGFIRISYMDPKVREV